MYRAFSYRRLRYFLAFSIGGFALLGAASAVEGDTAGAIDGLRTAGQFAMLAAVVELLGPITFEKLSDWARQRSQPEKQSHWEGWWDCPECDGDTRVIQTQGDPTRRECTECDWAFEFEVAGGDRYVRGRRGDSDV